MKAKLPKVLEPGLAPVKRLMPAIWAIIVLILLAYIPAFDADFVNWDDEEYVINNSDIRSFENFREIISKPVQGNYHPLTMLSLAFNYSLTGLDASSYHVLNILLHIVNSLLVFFFILRLTRDRFWLAFIVALLFGLHPLHVESVAWVSERKDLLYSCFFLGGLLYYLKYLDQKKIKYLFAVFLLFTLSVLSKPAAVIFPVVLLAIDFYKERLRSVKTYIEKIPFLILSIIIGLATMQAQSDVGSTIFADQFGLAERVLFATYGIMMYILKAIWPVSLCTFYPFPDVANEFPAVYLLSPLILLILVIVFFKSVKQHRLLSFSILFYLVNLALVIQLIPVGNAVIADRYAYLPLIGFFIIPAYYFQRWFEKNNNKLNLIMILLLVVSSLTMLVLTYKQASTWKNGKTLWDQALKVSPSSRAFVNRGLLYKKAGNLQKAFDCYSSAINLGTREPDAWVNRGNIYFSQGQYEKAIEDYTICLSLSSINVKAYENRGSAYASLAKPDLAMKDFNEALKLDSTTFSVYANRGMLMMSKGNFDSALYDFNHYLRLTSDPNGEIWSFSGEANFKLGRYEEALNCYIKAIGIRETGLYYLNRSKILFQMKRKKEAYVDALKAVEKGARVDTSYLQILEREIGSNPIY